MQCASMLTSRQLTSCVSAPAAHPASVHLAGLARLQQPAGGVPARRSASRQQHCSPVCRARDTETAEQTMTRRLAESAVVESRIEWVEDAQDLRQRLDEAGDKLVVFEIQGDGVCETGNPEEADVNWKLDEIAEHQRRMEACRRIKSGVQRVARECGDVMFLECMVPEGSDGDAMRADLGVQVLPTIQFYKNGRLLWQQQGFVGMEEEMREGVLYYGDAAAGGVKGTDYIKELGGIQDMTDLVTAQEPGILTVVNVSTTLCKPCIKVFPAVLALAKSFQGHATFAKLLGDASDDGEAAMKELGILEVPTFIFYRNGKELGRHVGSSRGDLIGRILQYQAEAGIAPPPPPPRVKPAPAAKARTARKVSRW